MEFLEGYSPRSELMTFLPTGETSANLSQIHTVTVIGERCRCHRSDARCL
jgi:hypothetical protein